MDFWGLKEIFFNEYLRNLHAILRNEKDYISVLKKKKNIKNKQTNKKTNKMIFSLAWNIMLTDY